MKIIKKAIAIFLTQLMVLSILTAVPVTFNAASSTTSGKCGDNVYWEFKNETLYISGNGAMYNYSMNIYSAFNPPWDSFRTNIINIDIADGVTTIGEQSFYNFRKLESITIPNSLISIGAYAFQYCCSITSITIPENVTEISSRAFSDCENFESINVSSKNIKYTSVDGVLFNKDKSHLLKYPEGKFGESYTIPNTVTSIGKNAFMDCINFTSIVIPDNVTSIDEDAFYNCTNLEEITLPDSLLDIDASTFRQTAWYKNQPDGVVYIGKIACGYKGSAYSKPLIDIKDGTKAIAKSAFQYTGLTRITIPSSVELIGYNALYSCEYLYNISVSNDNPNYASDNGVLFNKDKTFLIAYPAGMSGTYKIPDTVTAIRETAFNYCHYLNGIIIPDSVTKIEPYTFYGCGNVGKVVIGNNVKEIGAYAFYGCYYLANVTIPYSVTKIGNRAFGFYSTDERHEYTLDDFTITGYIKTAAETYAKENRFKFIGKCMHSNKTLIETIEPSCTKEGIRIFMCDNCGEFSETIPKLPHNYKTKINAATCQEEGAKTYRCTNCGYSYSEAIPKKAHTYEDTVVPQTDCTDGYTLHTCSDCGDQYRDNIIHVENPVHSFKNGVCQVCKHTDIELNQSEHNYSANTNQSWNFTRDNAYALHLTFSEKTETELLYDFIRIYDKNNNLVGEYSGDKLAGKTITVIGNTATVTLVTDELNSDFYGFSLTAVSVEYKGDVNYDGEITIDDVTDIQKAIASISEFDSKQNAIADIDGDGEVTIDDVTQIQKYLANIISELV